MLAPDTSPAQHRPAVPAVPDADQTPAWLVLRWQARVLAGLALLTLLAALGVLLAPVVADDPVLSWPPAGQWPRSTVLPLVPYRPLSLHARVPCTALSALDQRPQGGEALRTLPATASKPGAVSQGLVVAVHRGVVQVSSSGTILMREVLPAGGCTYRVLADAGGVRVLREQAPRGDGALRGSAALRVPEVSELVTDVEGQPASAGLAVSLHTDARYESTPTALKTSLLLGCALALLALLGLAWRWWGGRPAHPPQPIGRPRLGVVDAVLVVVSVVWVLLAPTNFDDSWYLLMARAAQRSGSVGNAIYMFNVTENPFVTSQYVLQLWGWLGQFRGVSWGLAWMRLLPLAYGLATWLLLRAFLVVSSGRQLGTGWAGWALLVAYLLWWLPYGMTLRPEPLIVLFAAATLLLAELARRRRSVGALAVATATAALAMSVSPSGLVAVAPLLLALPWLGRWLRAQRAVARMAALLLLGASGTSLVLVGFADATLGDVLESTAVHQWYYQTFSWYQESVHYQTILSFEDSSQWARRAPVVLTIAVLLLVAVGRAAQVGKGQAGQDSAGTDPLRQLLGRSAACSALALVLLAPTPTKFVNHFGAAAAAPTVLLAVALLRSPLPEGRLGRRGPEGRLGRRGLDGRLGRRGHCGVGVITAAAGTAMLVGAMSLSFAGPNLWRPYSDRGQPFGDHLTAAADHPDLGSMRPSLGPVQLANPTLWVAVALGAAAGMCWWHRRGRTSGLRPDRAVLLAGSTTIVVMTIVVFTWAPVRQYPGWSVAVSTIRAVQGESCALADYAQVLVDTAALPVPRGPAVTEGTFAAAASRPIPVPAPAPGTLVWHNALERDPRTGPTVTPPAISPPETGPPEIDARLGLLVTPWFTLPPEGGTTLLVPLLGSWAGQQLTLEYATAAGQRPAVAGSRPLPVDHLGPVDPTRSMDPTSSADPTRPRAQWRQIAIALDRLGPVRPARVRLVVRTRLSSTRSWLAVGQPRLARWRPLAALTAGAPVYVDQLTATLVPCVAQVGVEHGIARAPEVLVRSDEGFGRGFLDLSFELLRGGTLVPVNRCATIVRVPARLVPAGSPTLPWGRVERVVYDHPVGLVDLHVQTRRRAGWTRLPTLADKSYHGDPIG